MAKITIPNKSAGDQHTADEFNEVKTSVNALYADPEAHSEELTFNKNKYTDTAISQSGAIGYTLAASGNVDGMVIRHKIMSDGSNPITFSPDFNVFNKSEDDIYPSGLHIFYFNYVGGEVDVAIPTYSPETTEPTYEAPSSVDVGNITDTGFDYAVEGTVSVTPITPDELTNVIDWFDGTDETTMTINAGKVESISSKTSGRTLSDTGDAPDWDDVNELVEILATGGLDFSSAMAELSKAQDFVLYLMFRAGADDENGRNTLVLNQLGTDDRVAIGKRDGKIAAGYYDGSNFISKGTNFDDTSNFHWLRLENNAGTVSVELDGNSLTDENPSLPVASGTLPFQLGYGDSPFGFKHTFSATSMTSNEKAGIAAWLNSLL